MCGVQRLNSNTVYKEEGNNMQSHFYWHEEYTNKQIIQKMSFTWGFSSHEDDSCSNFNKGWRNNQNLYASIADMEASEPIYWFFMCEVMIMFIQHKRATKELGQPTVCKIWLSEKYDRQAPD